MATKKTGRGSADSQERQADAVTRAARAITQRYGDRYVNEGSKTLSSYVRSFQDVVAESSLTEKFSSKTLDAAAAKVAKKQYVEYGAGSEDKRKKRKANNK